MSEMTPMMKQYLEIKEQYKDAILFYRLGDFYEMFFEDAELVSRELELTLTGRNCGLDERAPMCGVPFHSADTYIARLISKGYKVAICEQVEDSKKAKNLVKREVVRIVTPGTILDEGHLLSKSTNYMCCVYIEDDKGGVAFCDNSTGRMCATWFDENASMAISDEMARFSPVEIILNIEAHRSDSIKKYLQENIGALSVLYNDAYFGLAYAKDTAKGHFGSGADGANDLIIRAAGALLSYLHQTQKIPPTHITEIETYTSAQFMEIDETARRNLELQETMRDKSRRGSLLWVIDDTKTTMGLRTLTDWLMRPLLGCAQITARLNAVDELFGNMELREGVREELAGVSDIERVMSRIVLGTANARDLIKLKMSLSRLPRLKELLSSAKSSLLLEQERSMEPLEDLCSLIDRGIMDDPPLTIREGNIIREGFSEELDELRRAKSGGREYLSGIEAEEREKTGIKNLRIGFNKVFGYYIEVSKSNLDKVPEYYIRKQTVANGERFITPKLKEIENIVLGAEERITSLEYELFTKIRNAAAEQVSSVQYTARAIGVTDALCSLASVATKNNYCRPIVNMSDVIHIKDGRHPVVEKVLKDSLFVPNDTTLDGKFNRLAIITGPNMAGKSTYMRQTALIVIMAQMGSFVPASSCVVGVCDKVFTRVGASDDLASGQSTFMVEMRELSHILKNATKNSLIILDEIGRGTSTYDGLSIAWSVLEYCAQKLRAKTLFATHYHELTQLEEKMDGVLNYSIAVKKRGDDIFFLRKIIRGGADESYGIEVAKLAGVPDDIISRAKSILAGLESENGEVKLRGGTKKKEQDTGQMNLSAMAAMGLLNELRETHVETLSPIEALNVLFSLTKKAKEIS